MRLYQFLKDRYNLCKHEVESFNHDHNVKINGIRDKWLSYILKPDDVVEVDGEVVEVISNEKVYLLLNKPVGITCTNDRMVENNIRDFLNYKTRVFTVGRLDKDSCGLIILTNDGQMFNRILDKNTHVEKEYLLVVDHPINDIFLDLMSKGVPILGKVTRSCKLKQVGPCSFQIILKEGMNRQIRRMCQFFGYKVKHLERIRIGSVLDSNLEVGKYRYLTESEINSLLNEDTQLV